jgi:type IV secretory pathway component VirB8
MSHSPIDWLQEQFDDSAKRQRLFKIVAIISQGMLFLGVIIIIWMLQDDLRSILGD